MITFCRGFCYEVSYLVKPHLNFIIFYLKIFLPEYSPSFSKSLTALRIPQSLLCMRRFGSTNHPAFDAGLAVRIIPSCEADLAVRIIPIRISHDSQRSAFLKDDFMRSWYVNFHTKATKSQCVQLRLDFIRTGHSQISQVLELEITGGQ